LPILARVALVGDFPNNLYLCNESWRFLAADAVDVAAKITENSSSEINRPAVQIAGKP
jgi:hypothetical protein